MSNRFPFRKEPVYSFEAPRALSKEAEYATAMKMWKGEARKGGAGFQCKASDGGEISSTFTCVDNRDDGYATSMKMWKGEMRGGGSASGFKCVASTGVEIPQSFECVDDRDDGFGSSLEQWESEYVEETTDAEWEAREVADRKRNAYLATLVDQCPVCDEWSLYYCNCVTHSTACISKCKNGHRWKVIGGRLLR